jgi:tetratricopeptide (TPR) repeat protein
MVNFFALAHATTHQGGVALLPRQEPHRLGVAALLYGNPAPDGASKECAAWEATRQAFGESVATFGPDDFYVLMQALESQFSALPFHQVMALLRMSRWDPQILAGCIPALMAALEDLSAYQWDELLYAIERTVEHDYLSTTRYDLPYSLGRLFLTRGEHVQALVYFERSLTRFGRNGQMLYEMALCYLELDNLAMARHWLDQALTAAPNHAPARELRLYLQRKSPGED